MAGMKRKAATPASTHGAGKSKKVKQEHVELPLHTKDMSRSKRVKQESTQIPLRANNASKSKRVKQGTMELPLHPEDLETVTDSDPIVESDTTEHSGDDDGESWPSDHEVEEDGKPQSAGDEHEAGGVALPRGSNSRESHAKQKAVAQERKAAKPNADSIARTKKLWERLRRKSHVPPAERKVLVAELFEIITGRVKEFVLKHDSVRVIQTALKYANKDQKRMIARELQGEYKALAQSRYAKFLIGKILVHGDDEIRDFVVPEFYGHVRRMINNPEASWILDDIYRGAATPAQKAALLREWYGAEFALFKSKGGETDTADLKNLLARSPEKRKPILRSLYDLINQLIQKKTTGFTMLHDAMLQYYLNVTPGSQEATEFSELLKGDEEGDLLKNLAFTKSGARVVCLALARGNAKDRKQLLRAYKGTIQLLMFDPYGHQVLLTAFDVIDDTVLISKSIISELFSQKTESEEAHQRIMSYATHLQARIPILYPLTGKVRSILTGEDLKLLNEVHELRSATSKKDPEVRRKEIIKAMSPYLLPFIEANASELVQARLGPQFISEVLLGADGNKEPALLAIADLTQGKPEVQKALEEPSASRMLKSLVAGGHYNPKTRSIEVVDPPLMFGDRLYAKIKDDVVNWAAGSNSFIVVGLLEAQDFTHKVEVEETLRKNRGMLQQVVDGGTRKEAEGDAKEEEKTRAAGRKGTALVLSKLG